MNDRSHRRLLASSTSPRKGFLTVERERALRGLLQSADGPRLSATDSDLTALRDMLILAPASAATAATQTETVMNPRRALLGLRLGAGSPFSCWSGSGYGRGSGWISVAFQFNAGSLVW